MKKSTWPRKGRVYILPTGFGLTFIVGAVVMILVGATYQNNLVNLLAFFMLSLVFIGMIQTHNNLKGITLEQLIADNGYAESDFVVTSVIGNPTREVRFSLESALDKTTPKSVYDNVHPLVPGSHLKLKAAYSCPRRGKYHLADLKVSTIYPLGLFRAWMWLDADATYFVYPRPVGQRPFPRGETAEPATGVARVRGGEDFYGHRRYQTGDALGHIDWKARARGRPLLVKEFKDGAPAPILLDWFALEGVETEERLSQLSAWVEDAQRRGITYGMRLPGTTITPSAGPAHAQRCLEALAVFDFETKEDARVGS